MHTTRFAHHRLDAFHTAKRALVMGDALVRKLPRGYGPLADQMRRALLGTYLQLTEAAARDGNDRRQRFRCARGECNEAAEAVEAAFWTRGAASQGQRPACSCAAAAEVRGTRHEGIGNCPGLKNVPKARFCVDLTGEMTGLRAAPKAGLP